MSIGIKIAKRHKDLDCKCFRIYYKNNKFFCELIYEKKVEQVEKNDRVAGIDIGLENLFTLAFNYNEKGISIKGDKLKAINQYFNKIKANLQSLLPQKQYVSKKINLLLFKRAEQSKENKLINADLNGALNILKKVGIKFIEPLEYLKYDNIFTSKLV